MEALITRIIVLDDDELYVNKRFDEHGLTAAAGEKLNDRTNV